MFLLNEDWKYQCAKDNMHFNVLYVKYVTMIPAGC
jgi:hypothetical protein